jgi:hypothetical protein
LNDISTQNGKREKFKNYTEFYFHVGTNDDNEINADWISHILHRDCFLKCIIEGNIEGMGS